MNAKLAEQIIKAAVNWNKGKVFFDKRFLELQDNTKLIVEDDGTTITLTTVFKKSGEKVE